MLKRGSRVLVVDDEPEIIELCEKSLARLSKEPYGLQLCFTTDPIEAIELANRQPVSLLVTDLNMPHMDGLTLLREIRHAPMNRQMGAILVTGNLRPDEWLSEAHKMGFMGVFAKPLSFGFLEKKIIEQFPREIVPTSPALA